MLEAQAGDFAAEETLPEEHPPETARYNLTPRSIGPLDVRVRGVLLREDLVVQRASLLDPLRGQFWTVVDRCHTRTSFAPTCRVESRWHEQAAAGPPEGKRSGILVYGYTTSAATSLGVERLDPGHHRLPRELGPAGGRCSDRAARLHGGRRATGLAARRARAEPRRQAVALLRGCSGFTPRRPSFAAPPAPRSRSD